MCSSKIKDLKILISILSTLLRLEQFYKIATTVFLGGSLVSKGGKTQ